MASLSKAPLLLSAITLSIAAGLALWQSLLAERMHAAKDAYTARLQAQVLPDSGAFIAQRPLDAFSTARDYTQGSVIRSTTPRGYSGEIVLLIGTTPSGHIRALRVLSHRETPGLGDRFARDQGQWYAQFEHHTTATLALSRDGGSIDAMSGATVTSRAIVEQARTALERWHTPIDTHD